jgi:sulfide:quinone oxidoreductase
VSGDIEAEAKKQGLPFHFIPVKSAPFDLEMVKKVQDVLDSYQGPVFFYCRTGTRCTNLWAISQAGKVPGKEIIEAASEAGYNIAHLGDQLD